MSKIKKIKKVFISQPMSGLSQREIKEKRKSAIKRIKAAIQNYDVKIIDSFIEEEPPRIKNISVWYLSKSIELLADADIAYFMDGWDMNRGCIIEHEVADKYGILTIYEEDVPEFEEE